MIMNFQTFLVTQNSEKRIDNDIYLLKIEGYSFFSIDQDIEIKKHAHLDAFGKAVVTEILWKGNHTYLAYRLHSLNSVN